MRATGNTAGCGLIVDSKTIRVANTSVGLGWQQFQYLVPATGPTMALTFTQGTSDQASVIIDDVVVSLVQ